MTLPDAAELGQTLFEEIGDAAFVVDPATDCLIDVNPMAERITACPRDHLLRLSLQELLRADTDQSLTHLRQALHGTQTFYSQEGYYCRQTNRENWLPVNLTITRLHTQRRPLGLILVRDISQRKEAEEALREAKATLEQNVADRTAELAKINEVLRSQMRELTTANESLALFRTLIDHTNDVIEVVDSESGRILDVNETACLAHGYTRDEYLALSVPEIDPMMAGRSWEEIRDEIRKSGSLVFESQHRRKDGSVFPVEVSVTLVRLERDYNLAIVRDIAERKRAEQRFASLLDAAPDAIVVVNPSGHIVLANKQTEATFGYGREELLHQSVEMLVPQRSRDVHPQHRAEYIENPTSRPMGAGLELFGLRKDGSEFPMDLCLSPLQTDDGLQVIAAVRDTTELKRLEQQFRQSQKMEAIGRLAGGVAHDFNNILTVIGNYTQLMLDGIQTDDPNLDALNEIQQASQRAAGLTRQLLAFSRKQVLQPRVVNLNSLLGNLLKMLERLIGEDVDVLLTLDPDLGATKIDPGHFEQAITNLVVNARDAMPEGGRLTIETRNTDITGDHFEHVPDFPAGSYVLVSVGDTGCGLETGTKSQIFEPFFTTKGPGIGTGLGLAMVYGFVKQSGGHVEVASEPNHGTAFEIYLPRVDAAVPLDAPSQEVTERPSGNETVLLVEDDEAVRTLSKRLLESSGYSVLEGIDGEDGLRVARAHEGPIHILVTDLVMPRMGGWQLVEQLCEERPDMRVLLISGYTQEQAVFDEVLESRIEFLQKPLTEIGLIRKVRDVLDAGKS
jgi:hypothetical protein